MELKAKSVTWRRIWHLNCHVLKKTFCQATESLVTNFVDCTFHRQHQPVAQAEKFHGGFHSWHMVVICIWCALFVTSQFDAIYMFPNQRFGEVC